jgi:two-component system chemotaxis response regulator CheY
MHILVVDDSKTIRYMLIRLLNELDYTDIAEAEDVNAGLLQIQVKLPDLIFSDYNMPGKNGIDFLKEVRQHPTASQVPFVMVTTMHDKKVIFEAVKAGLQHYIFKPLEKNVLADKLTALAESHHIQAPRKAVAAQWVAATAPASPPAGDTSSPQITEPGLSAEQCNAIIEHFFLVFDGEMTMQDFQTWATENVLAKLPETSRIKAPEQLLEILRSGSTSGIMHALKQPNV